MDTPTLVLSQQHCSRNQLWIGGANVYWERWTKTTLISNEINKDRYTHTGYNWLIS